MNSTRRDPDRRTGSERIKRLVGAGLVLCIGVGCVAWTSAGTASSKHGHRHHHNKPKPGPPGPRGATGPQGPPGRAGSGTLALTYVSRTTTPDGFDQDVQPHSFEFLQAFCPEEGQIATGGGVTTNGTFDDPVYVVESVSQAGGGWFGAVENRGDQPHSFTVWAVCTPGAKTNKAKASGKTGPPGPRGPRGATGPQGPPGAPGTGQVGQVALTYVTKQAAAQNGNTSGTATCPAGQHVTGGGVGSEATLGKQWLTDSGPTADGTGWTVSMDNFGAQPQFTVHAICTTSTAKSFAFPPSKTHAKRGPPGPRGRRGAAGPQGPPGTSPPVAQLPISEVAAPNIPAPAGAQTAGSVDCPAGQHITGGGFIHNSNTSNQMATNSAFPQDSDTWLVAVDNTSNSALSFEADAVCTPSVVATKR